MKPFYTHQQMELPKIEMEISHFILHQCSCPKCGKSVKAGLPGNDTGYGPRLSAFIAELSGIKAMSRSDSANRSWAYRLPLAIKSFPPTHSPPFQQSISDRSAIGRKAAEALLARIDGKENLDKIIDVGFKIIGSETA